MKLRFDRARIEALLPHRDCALFASMAEVDGDTVYGEVHWHVDHPHLQGHFPGMPIVPGVFLIEAGAQLAGIWIASQNPGGPGLGMLAGVRKTLVHHPVMPGDKINFTLSVRSNSANFFDVKGVAKFPDGRKAITLDVVIAVRAPVTVKN